MSKQKKKKKKTSQNDFYFEELYNFSEQFSFARKTKHFLWMENICKKFFNKSLFI